MPYSLVNLGYLIVLCAFLVRDMLLLRSLLLTAQVIVAVFSWSAGIFTVAGWNVVFGLINVVWIAILLRDRRAVQVPGDLRGIYDRHFAAMTPSEFMRFWKLGHRQTVRDLVLVSADSQPPALYFLLRGTARVTRGGITLADLPAGYFVGEMSLLTERPANADVRATGEVEMMQWPAEDILKLRDRQPSLWIRLQSVIGYDLVAKVQRGEQRAPSVTPSLAVT